VHYSTLMLGLSALAIVYGGFLALAQAVPDPLPVSSPPPRPVLAGALGPRAPPLSQGSST
jgi:hypothetical protein